MRVQGHYPLKIGSLITFLLIMLLTGCGGGGGSSSAETPAATVVPTLKANAGNIIGIRVGQVAYLDGSSSTSATSSALTYQWSFTINL